MNQQIVKTENHQIEGFHSYHVAYFENGRMVSTETDCQYSDGTWGHYEQREYQLTYWQKAVTVQEYMDDMNKKGLDPVLS